jgi:hypothetical protein
MLKILVHLPVELKLISREGVGCYVIPKFQKCDLYALFSLDLDYSAMHGLDALIHIGATGGAKTRILGSTIGVQKIVAVEPDLNQIPTLQKNLDKSFREPHILINFVTGKPEVLELNMDHMRPGSYRIGAERASSAKIQTIGWEVLENLIIPGEEFAVVVNTNSFDLALFKKILGSSASVVAILYFSNQDRLVGDATAEESGWCQCPSAIRANMYSIYRR